MEWQLIETAPKDGTTVLLFYDTLTVIISRWRVVSHTENGKETYRSEKWATDWLSVFGGGPQPTHWMPLPEPPK